MSIADLLVPNPYTLNLGSIAPTSVSTGALTVTGAAAPFPTPAASITSTSALIAPLRLDSPAGAISSGVIVRLGGVPVGALSANGSTNSFDMGSVAGSTASTGLFSAGTLRMRIPNAGLADTPTSTTSLTLSPSLDIQTMQVGSGSYTPVWTTVSGFGAPGAATGFYIRQGNFVHVCMQVLAVSAANGANIATITLPIAPAAPFGGSEAIGTCSMQTTAGGITSAALITAQPATTQIRLAITASNAFVAPFTASFIYRIA